MKKRLQRVLIPVHRWLGLGLSLVMLLWFASGIVMIFEDYPHYTESQRLADLPELNVQALATAPREAARSLGLEEPPQRVRVNQPGARPRMHLLTADGHWRSVHADSGEPVPGLDRQQARERARDRIPAPVAEVKRLTQPDQWTFSGQLEAYRPLWRVTLKDDSATQLYLSERTGELVHRTGWWGRVWGYAGPVIHWIYPTQLRRLSGFWRQLVMGIAGLGALACASGLILGLLAWRGKRRRHRNPEQGISPYSGWWRWHHYTGLVFGVLAFIWVFSGLLSLDPFFWAPSTRPDTQVQQLLSGPEARTAPEQSPLSVLNGRSLPDEVQELRWKRMNGRDWYRVLMADQASVLVPVAGGSARARRSDAFFREAAGDWSGKQLEGWQRLEAYDHYYHAGRAARVRGENPPLPVYRARYQDGTRLYMDPASGDAVHVSRPKSRLKRWLFQGLHSLEFPVLNPGSGLWYSLVVGLMLGGTALCLTSVWLTLRYFLRP